MRLNFKITLYLLVSLGAVMGGLIQNSFATNIILTNNASYSVTSAELYQLNTSLSMSDIDEMVLTFSYPSLGRVYINAVYDYRQNKFLLPVIEIFNRLEINNNQNGPQGLVEGIYLIGGEPYKMNFIDKSIRLGNKTFSFNADEMILGETEFYVSPSVFREVFDMHFDLNMSTLSARLSTSKNMPITDRRRREQARKNIEKQALDRTYHPLRYKRSHNVIGAGFLDYQFSTTGLLTDPSKAFGYTFTGAAEVFGGGLQGNLTGEYTEQGGFSYTMQNVRWRYALDPNHFLTEINAGQVSTRGPLSQSIRGITLTNDPIEARQSYGTYVFEGRTEPDSEIELYLNGNLIDFAVADQLGYYRFDVPLRYGTSRLETRIITPDGNLRTRDREILVPFMFLPVGTVGYNAEFGSVETEAGPFTEEGLAMHGNIGYGFSEWLTARVGLDYSDIENTEPLVYSSASLRLFGMYLLNTEIVPNAFYRTQTNVVFPSSHSLNLGYTYYDGISRFNRRGMKQQFSVSAYTPLRFINSGFRAGLEASEFENQTQARITSDLFTRLGRLNIRFNYRDQVTVRNGDYTLSGGLLRTSATYTISRNGNIPAPLRGTFIRGSALYDVGREELLQVDGQISRSVGKTGRFTFGVSHLMKTGETITQFGLNLDLSGRVRSATDVRSRSGTHTYRQSLRGSIGFDAPNRYIQLNDRQQAGQSAATVTLFVDNSGSGTYEPDKGDEILPHNAIRLDRSSQARIGADGRLRISQLQSFYRYNLEVNRRGLPNPMLVPAIDKFSFITNPNSYKQIEIPFYRTGLIDGQVSILRNGNLQGMGGLRLFLKGLDTPFNEIIRTFHGGGFYAMDIPPGRYTMEVDPAQLDFLDVVARDGILNFTIQPMPQGHFLDGLDIVLVSKEDKVAPTIEVEPEVKNNILAGIILDYYRAFELFLQAQNVFSQGDFVNAITLINQSLALFESDFALALKGSIEYLLGNRTQAVELWNEAKKRNPQIEIPDVELLDSLLERYNNQ